MKSLSQKILTLIILAVMLFQFTMADAAIQNNQTENAITNQILYDEPGTTTRVSVASDGTQGNESSGYASISADGRYVAFQSRASNLVSWDTATGSDIFVHDRQTGETTLVSVASDGTKGNNISFTPSISADGRYVAFYSYASNLVPGDTNNSRDIFVHDCQTGQTTRVSVDSEGNQANGASEWPAISADGRYVAFQSVGTNLVPGETNGSQHIFVHDQQTKETTIISKASDGSQGNNHSWYPSISADGRYVAFHSEASNLVPEDTNERTDVFVHDRLTGQTTQVSVTSDGTQGNGSSASPTISADGRYVAFESVATNLRPGFFNYYWEIFVHDRHTGETRCVSDSPDDEQSNMHSTEVSLSADGRYVAFRSGATNLVPEDTNNRDDVFVHDQLTGVTTRVSVASDGTQGNGNSSSPSISANGCYVAFDSGASNLVAGDTNGYLDVFVNHYSCDEPVEPPEPSFGFLELPFVDEGNGLNKINSFFDHQYPNRHIGDGEPEEVSETIVIYTGELFDGTIEKCKGRNERCYSGHNGYDFGLPAGTEVRAAAAGVVTSGAIPCGGRYVAIDHLNGYQTIYRHLENDKHWKLSGKVEAGERIGTVGANKDGYDTCWTGPHLHFEVRYNEQGKFTLYSVVDPYGWRACNPRNDDPWVITMEGPISVWLWKFSPPVCAKISAGSAQVLSTTDNVFVNIPAGAISGNAIVGYNIAPEPDGGFQSIGVSSRERMVSTTIPTGYTFQISAMDLDGEAVPTFLVPINIDITYEDSDLEYAVESTLALYRWDSENKVWIPLATSLDAEGKMASADTDKAGIFSLRAQPMNPAPIITNVSPSTKAINQEITVLISGENFLSTPRINLDLGSYEVEYLSSSLLSITIPPSIPSGIYDLSLHNPDGQSVVLPNGFTILQSVYLPLITH